MSNPINLPYSERKDAANSINLGALFAALLSAPLMYWGYTQDTHWKKVLAYANGLGLLAVSAQLSKLEQLLSLRNQAMSDMYDQLSVQAFWENKGQQLLPPSTGNSGSATLEGGDNPGVPEMQWSDFVTTIINNPKLYPHIAILAPTGAGKTLTAEVIGDLRAAYYRSALKKPRQLYMSPIVDPDEFLGWELVGKGFDKTKLNEFVTFLQYDLIKRYEVPAGAKEGDTSNAPPIIIAIDEYRWVAKECYDAPSMLGDGLSMGRRRDMNFILMAQGKGVKTLKMEGEGDLRAQYVEVLKGAFVLERVSILESEGRFPQGSTVFVDMLLQSRPYDVCLVQDKLMLLPSLSVYRTAKKNKGITYANPPEILLPNNIENTVAQQATSFANPYSKKGRK